MSGFLISSSFGSEQQAIAEALRHLQSFAANSDISFKGNTTAHCGLVLLTSDSELNVAPSALFAAAIASPDAVGLRWVDRIAPFDCLCEASLSGVYSAVRVAWRESSLTSNRATDGDQTLPFAICVFSRGDDDHYARLQGLPALTATDLRDAAVRAALDESGDLSVKVDLLKPQVVIVVTHWRDKTFALHCGVAVLPSSAVDVKPRLQLRSFAKLERKATSCSGANVKSGSNAWVCDETIQLDQARKRLWPSLPPAIRECFQLDKVALYSTTCEALAERIAGLCAEAVQERDLDAKSTCAAVDLCAGIGGNTMALARRFMHVEAIEIDEQRAKMLCHNLAVGLASEDCSTQCHCCDCLVGVARIAATRPIDVLFFDPPWTFADYGTYRRQCPTDRTKSLDASDIQINGFGLVSFCKELLLQSRAPCLVLKLPSTLNVDSFVSEVQAVILGAKLRTIERWKRPRMLVVVFRFDQSQDTYEPALKGGTAEAL